MIMNRESMFDDQDCILVDTSWPRGRFCFLHFLGVKYRKVVEIPWPIVFLGKVNNVRDRKRGVVLGSYKVKLIVQTKFCPPTSPLRFGKSQNFSGKLECIMLMS